MYTAVRREILEEILPPKKLLYLCDAALTDTAAEIADSVGALLASYPSASPNYMRETAVVWARYNAVSGDHEAPDYGALRMQYAAKIVEKMPRAVAPPAALQHCENLVRLLGRVAETTSFTRTGDEMVHKLIMTMVEPSRAAALSIREAPYTAAGSEFGGSANKVVRGLFERDVPGEFKATCWGSAHSVADFIFFLYILFEGGEDIGIRLACNHEAAFVEMRSKICFFVWRQGIGFIAQNRIVYADSDHAYPIPSVVLAGLEMLAMSEYSGMEAAESFLCAAKTPEKVGAYPPPAQVGPPLTRHGLEQMGVRDSLYRLVHNDVSRKKNGSGRAQEPHAD